MHHVDADNVQTQKSREKIKQEMRTTVAAIEEVFVICARLTEKPNGFD